MGLPQNLLDSFVYVFTDELVESEALQSFETPGKIVGIQEFGNMSPELIMIDVMEALDSRLLDRAIHALGPGVSGPDQAMLVVIPGANQIKGMSSERFLFCAGAICPVMHPSIPKKIILPQMTGQNTSRVSI